MSDPHKYLLASPRSCDCSRKMLKINKIIHPCTTKDKTYFQELPGAIVDDPVVEKSVQPTTDTSTTKTSQSTTSDSSDDAMKIAWRYQNKPQVQVRGHLDFSDLIIFRP